MADYNREILQALREIAVEMKGIRSELRGVKHAMQGIDKRLATSGGLTNALTRRAHLVVCGVAVKSALCSACGRHHGVWLDDVDETLARYGETCNYCDAVFSKEVAFE